MGFIETSYGSNPNLSQVNIDSNLNMGTYSIMAAGESLTGNLDMNNQDIINVNKLLCNDFFTALSATASDDLKKEFIEDNLTTTAINTEIFWDKYIRIPSNIIPNSTIRIKFYYVAVGNNSAVAIYKYDPITQTMTFIKKTPTYTSSISQWESLDITVSGGELYTFSIWSANLASYCDFQQGIKISYDAVAVVDAIWEVIE